MKNLIASIVAVVCAVSAFGAVEIQRAKLSTLPGKSMVVTNITGVAAQSDVKVLAGTVDTLSGTVDTLSDSIDSLSDSIDSKADKTDIFAGGDRKHIAIGDNARSTGGDYSVAVGDGVWATGRHSFALGAGGVRAFGEASVAIGNSVSAIGDCSTALGYNSHAYVDTATALGGNSHANGERALAAGWAATVDSLNATSLGNGAHVLTNAVGAVAIGSGAVVGNNATNAVQLGFGRNNDAGTLQFMDKKVRLAGTYPLFIIDINSGQDCRWTDIELKGTTNNFVMTDAPWHELVFWGATADNEIRGGSVTHDWCRIFVSGHYKVDDSRIWTRVSNFAELGDWVPKQVAILVCPTDPDAIRRGQGSSWCNEANDELIWSYLRFDVTGPETDVQDGKAKWREIMPVKWYTRIPEWANQ